MNMQSLSVVEENAQENVQPTVASQYSHISGYYVEILQRTTKRFFANYSACIKKLLVTLFHIAIVSYFGYATFRSFEVKNSSYLNRNINTSCTESECRFRSSEYSIDWCNGYGFLLIIIVLSYVLLVYYSLIKPIWGEAFYRSIIKPLIARITLILNYRYSKVVLVSVVIITFAAYLVYDTTGSRNRLQSLAGITTLMAIGFLFSKHPSKINWQPVVVGFCTQFTLGLISIRWTVGRNIFHCIGAKVEALIGYSDVGSEFVYGNLLITKEGVFALKVLSVLYFFGFLISVLYYWGIMQRVVQSFGSLLQSMLGTTLCESVVCSGNIFLGMSESILLIQPYIKYLTDSELHAIISSGFATVAGMLLGAYVSFGAESAHLITSTVMAAPGALCFAKLFYPETEESKTSANTIQVEKSTDTSVLGAAVNGATMAFSLVSAIISILIAVVAFVAFLNGMLSWFGGHVDADYLSLEMIFGKLFIPLAWLIGIPWSDCEQVANIIATKTIINEFVAFEKLGKLKLAKSISARSSAITTYAICGFANPCSVGIIVAMLCTMAPNKRDSITAVVGRAFVSGCIICFITASIAGLLLSDEFSDQIINN